MITASDTPLGFVWTTGAAPKTNCGLRRDDAIVGVSSRRGTSELSWNVGVVVERWNHRGGADSVFDFAGFRSRLRKPRNRSPNPACGCGTRSLCPAS